MPDKRQLECPLCHGIKFKREQGKIDSRWGVTAHKVYLFICETCRFIMYFSKGRTIWDFD